MRQMCSETTTWSKIWKGEKAEWCNNVVSWRDRASDSNLYCESLWLQSWHIQDDDLRLVLADSQSISTSMIPGMMRSKSRRSTPTLNLHVEFHAITEKVFFIQPSVCNHFLRNLWRHVIMIICLPRCVAMFLCRSRLHLRLRSDRLAVGFPL